MDPRDYSVLKIYFTAFGRDTLMAFKDTYEANGMDFQELTTKQLGKTFVKEVKELLNSLNEDSIDFEKVLKDITKITSRCFMLYMNAKQKK